MRKHLVEFEKTLIMNSDQVKEAAELFDQGYSCSQAVFSVYAKFFGLDPVLALKIATSFGAGIGRTGNVCGAVSGAILAIGLGYGMCTIDDTGGREKSYARDQIFIQKFTERFGSIQCRDLLGYNLAIPTEMEEAKKQGVVKQVCPGLVKGAVEILQEIIR